MCKLELFFKDEKKDPFHTIDLSSANTEAVEDSKDLEFIEIRFTDNQEPDEPDSYITFKRRMNSLQQNL